MWFFKNGKVPSGDNKDNLTTFIALPILTTQRKSLKYNVPYKRLYTLCMVTDHLTWYKPELIQVLSC